MRLITWKAKYHWTSLAPSTATGLVRLHLLSSPLPCPMPCDAGTHTML